ncbi:MAG: hypothetical protein JRI57_02300 [Deltaproteobacteria bacterium]|nr:hypothetical protein [Deltaproteobacteria bacterium]MBW1951864.1 hypothetical protein [Deltaproteobacteria bacterium]MBW1986556.1 hypothetical protein [Deltaproteobacteria bacterium]MBW2134510.1 hypothetical protein [Deltaproteobacteria bacterium]
MENRKAYPERLEAQLQELAASIDELQAQADKAAAEAGTKNELVRSASETRNSAGKN